MLKSNYMGLELDNPVIVAAGPWSRDGSSIRRCFQSGAGAVVTESIVSDAILDVRPRIAYNGMGAENIRLYSDVQIEGWEREMHIAKAGGGKVIASVSAHTPSEMAYLTTKLEKFGADAIEISISNPYMESLEVMASDAERVYRVSKEVVSNVDIPVAVKLSQNTTNIMEVAKAVKEAGAGAVSAINTVRGILGVDLDTKVPALGTYGGYSGPPIKPLGLSCVASIAQSVHIPISGIGGICNYRDALEYMMLGATTVQMGTAMMINGPEAIKKTIDGLEKWCAEKGIHSLEEIRGCALENLRSFEEMRIEPAISTVGNVCCTDDCNKCIEVCLYDAISRHEGNIEVNQKRCTGCGLCTCICPTKKLELNW